MPVIISLLRGVNVGGNNLIKMDQLRELYVSLGLSNPQTYVQSGNVVFETKEKNLRALAKRIGDAIEKKLKFRPEIVVRTASELKNVLARNPFAKRCDIHPSKLLINFLADAPAVDVRDAILGLKLGPEEVVIDGREIFIYFPDGMGRSKLWPAIAKRLGNSGTGRNLNTVTKLLEMAEKLPG